MDGIIIRSLTIGGENRCRKVSAQYDNLDHYPLSALSLYDTIKWICLKQEKRIEIMKIKYLRNLLNN